MPLCSGWGSRVDDALGGLGWEGGLRHRGFLSQESCGLSVRPSTASIPGQFGEPSWEHGAGLLVINGFSP